MRPNIQITHELNGRVEDLATAWGLSLSEAYRLAIESGLNGLESEEQMDSKNGGKAIQFDDCPWCGDPVGDVENARWHLENCPE